MSVTKPDHYADTVAVMFAFIVTSLSLIRGEGKCRAQNQSKLRRRSALPLWK
jgi:hypothetical protein